MNKEYLAEYSKRAKEVHSKQRKASLQEMLSQTRRLLRGRQEKEKTEKQPT